MSVHVTSWVWQHSTVEHRGDLLVLLVLADHAHDDGTSAYPSVAAIAQKARLSRRGAQQALRRLEDGGAIARTAAGGQHRPATYRVLMPPDAHSLRSAPAAQRSDCTVTRDDPDAHSLHGGEVSNAQGRTQQRPGAQSPAPEPSLTTRNHQNSPRARASAREAAAAKRTTTLPPIDDEQQQLAEHIRGILQRGVDGLTTNEPAKPPTRHAILAALNASPTPADTAIAVARDTRAIAQAQDRAPNIAALYANKLAEAAAKEAACSAASRVARWLRRLNT